MREPVCFVLMYIFVNTVVAVKPKSVNLALETVLQFDKKDHSADVEVLNRVQSFLDNIRNVMASSKSGRRTNDNHNDIKFTDFLIEAARVLKNYDDNDLEDFFAVLDDQSRKYNYKGCKFYELVDNHDVRRFMSNKLEQAKDTSAKDMRRFLTDVIKVMQSENYDERDRGIVNLVNSLYDGVSDRFDNVVQSLRAYQERTKDADINLEDIVSTALRSLFFDHYSNLNDNARQQLKEKMTNFWQGYQGNGVNKHYTNADIFNQRQDYNSKLRVIDVTKFNNANNIHKWREGYFQNMNQKVTPSNQPDFAKIFEMSSYTNRPASKMDIPFIDFKKRTRDVSYYTRDQKLRTKAKETKKRYIKKLGYTKALNDDDFLKSNKFKRLTVKGKSLIDHKKNVYKKKDKYIRTTKMYNEEKSGSESFETDVKKKKSEIRDRSSPKDSSDSAKGISIEINNAKYIKKLKKKHHGKMHAKKNTKHGTNYNDHILRRKKLTKKSQRYSDDASSDEDLITDNNSDSVEEVKASRETIQAELGKVGVLTGGQKIHDIHYRAEHKSNNEPKKPGKISDEYEQTDKKTHRNKEVQNQKVKEILTDYNANFNIQISTKKSRDRSDDDRSFKKRQKPQKSLNKSKERNKVKHPVSSEAYEEYNQNTNGGRGNKLYRAFKGVSSEGITIESFENENVHKHSIVRKAHNLTTGNNNVSKLIHNLEKQLVNVKEQIAMAKGVRVNKTEGGTNKTVKFDDDQKENAFEIQVISGTTKLNAAEMTSTKLDKTTTVKNESVKAIKRETSSTNVKNDINSKKETKVTTSATHASPVFRSHDDDYDSSTSQETVEKYSIKNTSNATKADVFNNTTTLRSEFNLKLNKTTMESKSITSLQTEDGKSKILNNATMLSEVSKNTTTTTNKGDGEEVDAQTVKDKKTATYDLTKHLNESDTVILNIDDKDERNKTDYKEDMRRQMDKMGLPELQDDKFDDPFNDLDVNLNFMT